ncbi:MAG: hypothetical protein ABIH00_10275 [Armatimonadota bacterium]
MDINKTGMLVAQCSPKGCKDCEDCGEPAATSKKATGKKVTTLKGYYNKFKNFLPLEVQVRAVLNVMEDYVKTEGIDIHNIKLSDYTARFYNMDPKVMGILLNVVTDTKERPNIRIAAIQSITDTDIYLSEEHIHHAKRDDVITAFKKVFINPKDDMLVRRYAAHGLERMRSMEDDRYTKRVDNILAKVITDPGQNKEIRLETIEVVRGMLSSLKNLMSALAKVFADGNEKADIREAAGYALYANISKKDTPRIISIFKSIKKDDPVYKYAQELLKKVNEYTVNNVRTY